jgi:hypothetical protein
LEYSVIQIRNPTDSTKIDNCAKKNSNDYSKQKAQQDPSDRFFGSFLRVFNRGGRGRFRVHSYLAKTDWISLCAAYKKSRSTW